MERREKVLLERGYVITKSGDVINPKGVEIGYINADGYHCASIKINGKCISVRTHRVQAYQKYGELLYHEGVVARHFDGHKLNNSWDNILIGTHSQNMMDIPAETRMKNALHATSFVRKYDKESVREFHSLSRSYKNTMEMFGITNKGTLHFILNS